MFKVISLVILFVSFAALQGHAPSDMEITFDSDDLVLTIVIEHQVGNPETHYVDKVTVSSERREMVVHQISRQDDNQQVTLKYRIPDAKPGMTLTILATCNRVGRLTRSIEIE